MTTALDTPPDLGDAGLALWESITLWAPGSDEDPSDDDSHLLWRPDDIAVLHEACATRDLIASLTGETKSAPAMMPGSRGQQVINPAIQELRQQRQLLASLLRQLGLPDHEGKVEGKAGSGESPEPKGEWDGLSASQRARKAAGKRWRS